MPDITNILSLPLIQPSQAQKHITHNEAIATLDVLVQMGVVAYDLTVPPVAPTYGDAYIVATGGSAEWAGHDGEIAAFINGVWLFYAPRAGWRAYVTGRDILVVYDGTDWAEVGHEEVQNLTLLGVGTAADATNPFAAKVNNALWTAATVAEGGNGDLNQTLNKETTGDDVGLVLQSGYSTRALIGLYGSDGLRISVSPDGSTFNDAVVVDQATGRVGLPNLVRFKAVTNFDNFGAQDTWTKLQINVADYNAQGAFDAATNLFTAPVDGTYMLGATLQFKIDATTSARMSGRLVVNGAGVINGSHGEMAGGHNSGTTAVWLQTLVELSAGDTVELQGHFRLASGYFASTQTSFWGYQVG